MAQRDNPRGEWHDDDDGSQQASFSDRGEQMGGYYTGAGRNFGGGQSNYGTGGSSEATGTAGTGASTGSAATGATGTSATGTSGLTGTSPSDKGSKT